MKPIDIAPNDLKTVQAILREHVPEYEVRAFGSRVQQTAKKTSDLDLAVVADKPLDAARMADLREAFSQSALPFKVDIVDLAKISESFRHLIEGDFVVILCPEARKTP